MHTLDDFKANQPQKERLFYIDFRLRFLGEISRQNLTERFGIQVAAASRDLSWYKELAPFNLEYSTKSKGYHWLPTFTPLFNCSVEQALSALVQGMGDSLIEGSKPLIHAEKPVELSRANLKLGVIAPITQGIHLGRAVAIQYFSTTRGHTEREIVPFTIIDNGLRWHTRAFDRESREFRDFVLTRISSASLTDGQAEGHELSDQDKEWNRFVELEISPHPNQEHPETIEFDYNMTDGIMPVSVRATSAGYLLRRWNIDCSSKGSLKGNEYQLWLRNNQVLYGVATAFLAPGYLEKPDLI